MPQATPVHNPFMLMLNPEIVLAAMERSEHLSQLNRHFCRPLDKPVLTGAVAADDSAGDDGDAADEPGDSSAA